MMKPFLTLFLSLFSISAYSDWYELGAAYLCEKNPQRLTIAATQDSSNDWQIIRKEEGFTSFETGETTIHCHVGTKNISAIVKVKPPSNGRCMGIGNVSVQILPRKKDGYPIFSDIVFANSCYGDDGRKNIKVIIEEKAGNELITTCAASDSEDDNLKDVYCDTKPIAP